MSYLSVPPIGHEDLMLATSAKQPCSREGRVYVLPLFCALKISDLTCAGARSVRAGKDSMQSGRAVNHPKHAIQSYNPLEVNLMNNIVYIVGAIVIIVAILSFFGLR